MGHLAGPSGEVGRSSARLQQQSPGFECRDRALSKYDRRDELNVALDLDDAERVRTTLLAAAERELRIAREGQRRAPRTRALRLERLAERFASSARACRTCSRTP